MTMIEHIFPGLSLPVLQAPMAGVSTPALAAAVAGAGGVGGLGLGAMDVPGAERAILETRALTGGPFVVNLFCHAPPHRDGGREAGWIDRLRPFFDEFHAPVPTALGAPYESFRSNVPMLAMLERLRPPAVSFHFGLPEAAAIRRLKAAGIPLLASVTSPAEGAAARAAGMDAVIAQGWEAGGHRGIFDPGAPDRRLPTLELTRLLARMTGLPVIAAGGLMDRADLAAARAAGAAAAQSGTAFLLCPEAATAAAHRDLLIQGAEAHQRGVADAPRTTMTRAISGRPARGLATRFTDWAETQPDAAIPDYPVTYDAGKALARAAGTGGDDGFGAWWAGANAGRIRALPAAGILRHLSG